MQNRQILVYKLLFFKCVKNIFFSIYFFPVPVHIWFSMSIRLKPIILVEMNSEKFPHMFS